MYLAKSMCLFKKHIYYIQMYLTPETSDNIQWVNIFNKKIGLLLLKIYLLFLKDVWN